MARRRRGGRSVRKSRDLVWITSILEETLLEGNLDLSLLVIPNDWASATNGFDRATLLSIRGWLHVVQLAASTSTEATGIWLSVYKTDQAVAVNSFDPHDALEYNVNDTLWTGGAGLNLTTGTSSPLPVTDINIKTRRKLTSADSIRLAYTIPTDTATPRVNVIGCLRCLLQLDPPG